MLQHRINFCKQKIYTQKDNQHLRIKGKKLKADINCSLNI